MPRQLTSIPRRNCKTAVIRETVSGSKNTALAHCSEEEACLMQQDTALADGRM